MLKSYAKVFGFIFIIIGILGFIPGITYKGDLLGIFHVNAVHNFAHLATGIIAYLASRSSLKGSQMFFQIFGIIYVALGLIGFGYGNRDVFGMMANNLADTWLHLIVGLFWLYLGFLYKNK